MGTGEALCIEGNIFLGIGGRGEEEEQWVYRRSGRAGIVALQEEGEGTGAEEEEQNWVSF